MKKGMRGAKGVLFLFLVAVLVIAGVLSSPPGKSQAAAKTTYNVVIQEDSSLVSIVSVGNGPVTPYFAQNEGTTFQMQVDTKAKTETLKVGKTTIKATYYPVTILAKSYKSPSQEFELGGRWQGGNALESKVMPKNATGKLYISDSNVDVTNVLGATKLKTTIGDGTVDPPGSLIIGPFTILSVVTVESTGEMFVLTGTPYIMTTSQSSILVKGSKSKLEKKALPNDSTGVLPTPLVGQPIDLDAGTGTLVGTGGVLKGKSIGGMV